MIVALKPDFFRRHLEPSTRLGELLFGLIMALGITGAVRFGLAEANNHGLFIAVLGCNIAWGIVDGVMFAMLALFERARKSRIVNAVRNAPSDQAALEQIHEELGDQLDDLMTSTERDQVYRWVLDLARRSEHERPRIHRKDIFGGIAVGVLILVATLPIVIPFCIVAIESDSSSPSLQRHYIDHDVWNRLVVGTHRRHESPGRCCECDRSWFNTGADYDRVGRITAVIANAASSIELRCGGHC